MEQATISQRMTKAEIKLAEHELGIKENSRSIAHLEASCDNFKEFMSETRAEARAREKSLNKFATIIGIVSFFMPFITAWVVSLFNA